MEWLYPLSGFVVGAVVGLDRHGWRILDDTALDFVIRHASSHGCGHRSSLRRSDKKQPALQSIPGGATSTGASQHSWPRLDPATVPTIWVPVLDAEGGTGHS